MDDEQMTFGRRDHFTPQGYLKGFIHPDRSYKEKPLWVFDIQKQRWRERGTAEFGWVRGLYDYPVGSNADATADDSFRTLEDRLPTARDAIRRKGFETWKEQRETLVRFAAMLSARSLLFLREAAASIRPSIGQAEAEALSRNYSITLMRQEIQNRGDRWMKLNWALRYSRNPDAPVATGDQAVGMDGRVPKKEALDDPDTTLFVPLAWDMCLFGSPAPLSPDCDEFCEPDLNRVQSFLFRQARVFVASPVRLDAGSLLGA